jgi:hypothetical protein
MQKIKLIAELKSRDDGNICVTLYITDGHNSFERFGLASDTTDQVQAMAAQLMTDFLAAYPPVVGGN